ncbi:MAG TPA: DUF2784 domain-containing protein [Pseudonocardiaceae bacterium]
MFFRVLDDATVTVHYLVMAYIVFGGFVAWRWRRTLLVHLAFIGWAAVSLSFPVACPLTMLENYLRHRGGLPSLDGGFVDTYLTGVLYPASAVRYVQILAGAVVLGSWVGLYLRGRRGGGAERLAPPRTVGR